jgi:outer membrane protein assembly factor BamB
MRWKTPIVGKGWSSPVVADGRVWLTTATTTVADPREAKRKLAGDPIGDTKEVAGSVTLYAICLDLETGEELQRRELAQVTDPQPINPLNTYASPTPVIDGGRVYCDFGNYGTWCLDAQTGQTIWHRQIELKYSVGPGSSPLVYQGRLILVCDGCDRQFVTALDSETGEELWRTNRPQIRAADGDMKKSFSSPIVIRVGDQDQVVVPGAQWLVAYDPASGRELWRFEHGDGFSLAVVPIFADGLVIFSTGFMRPELVAVRADGRGDVTKTHEAWRASRGAPNKPSPVVAGDSVYMVADNGVLTQLRLSDGRQMWRQRIGDEYSASPIIAGDKIYFAAHDGTVSVVQAGAKFQLLFESKLDERILASPAPIDGGILIRTESAVMRFNN